MEIGPYIFGITILGLSLLFALHFFARDDNEKRRRRDRLEQDRRRTKRQENWRPNADNQTSTGSKPR